METEDVYYSEEGSDYQWIKIILIRAMKPDIPLQCIYSFKTLYNITREGKFAWLERNLILSWFCDKSLVL